jgi:hypothetical protein
VVNQEWQQGSGILALGGAPPDSDSSNPCRERDGAIAGAAISKNADSEATLRVENADDVAPAGERGTLGANGLGTEPWHSSRATLRCAAMVVSM